MKFPFSILKFLGLIICSYLIGRVLYGSYHSDNIFAVFMYVGLGLIWLTCFYHIVKNELNDSLAKFKVTKHWMSVTSVLTLVPIIIIFVYYQRKLNVPTLLKAQRHGVYADFKTDGTYIIKSGSWASRIHLYGKYTLHDSIIEIDTSRINNVLVSNRFLIKHSIHDEEIKKPSNDKLDTEKYLVQIDKTGDIIKTRPMGEDSLGTTVYLPFRFEVVVDNAK